MLVLDTKIKHEASIKICRKMFCFLYTGCINLDLDYRLIFPKRVEITYNFYALFENINIFYVFLIIS